MRKANGASRGFTFLLDVPESMHEEAEDFMDQLAMECVTDPNEIQERFEIWMEAKLMEDCGLSEE